MSVSVPNCYRMFSMMTVVPTQTRELPEFHQRCQRPSNLLRAMQVEQRMEIPLSSTVGRGKAGALLSHTLALGHFHVARSEE